MPENKLAATFIEEFKSREWRSEKLKKLANGEKIGPGRRQKLVSGNADGGQRAWWTYDEDN